MRFVVAALFVLSLAVPAKATLRLVSSVHTAQGYSCSDAIQEAQRFCGDWMAKISSELHVVEPPFCPREACICDGSGFPYASCPGGARYDDFLPPSGTQRVQYMNKNAVGFSCNEALFRARTDLYQWLSDFTHAKTVTQFDLTSPCPCTGGGTYQASCGGTATYLDAL